MEESSQELPNRRSVRLKDYDYSRAGAYFVTICVQDKQCIFGKVEEDKVIPSALGVVVGECWRQIPEHFENAILDEFIVMPNHVHGIIVLKDQTMFPAERRDTIHRVRPNIPESQTESFADPTIGTVSTIVRTFKAAVTREGRQKNLLIGTNLWQGRFFERIIRDERGLNRAREYVVNNPLKWQRDKENPDRLP